MVPVSMSWRRKLKDRSSQTSTAAQVESILHQIGQIAILSISHLAHVCQHIACVVYGLRLEARLGLPRQFGPTALV